MRLGDHRHDREVEAVEGFARGVPVIYPKVAVEGITENRHFCRVKFTKWLNLQDRQLFQLSGTPEMDVCSHPLWPQCIIGTQIHGSVLQPGHEEPIFSGK